jgi:hypothetical protein
MAEKKIPAKVMKSVIRRTVRQSRAHDTLDPQGEAVSQERCARFMRRHPSFDPISSPTPCESEIPPLLEADAES